MEIITKKLSDLQVPEKNVRIHTEKQLQEYEKSVRMFGQLRPIVIDESNTILAGRGLYDTLKRMGREMADCYQYTDLTENQKKKLMIADNKIFSLGIEDLDTLNEFLFDLQDDLDIPGFDEEILKQMVADEDAITEKISEYGVLDEPEIKNIRESGERVEQKCSQASMTQSAAPDAVMDGNTSAAGTPPQPPAGREMEDQEGPYVTCPECGAKIWL